MADLHLAKPLTLPCGLVLPNRLVKAAMTEQMSDKNKLPTPDQFNRTYGAWDRGGWGLVQTGNVQVEGRYLGGPDDTAMDEDLPETQVLDAYRKLVRTCSTTPTIVQINHPGRQSPVGAGKRGLFTKTLAPSAVPLNLGSDLISRIAAAVVFGKPREMTVAEIENVIAQFARAARIAAEAGFAGIQIHAAHGYLLAQFMSARINQRMDAYGGSAAGRAKIVVDIVLAIRAEVPKTFCVGIKFNSVDHQSRAELAECLEQLRLIVGTGMVDFLEVSGGTYESPLMISGNGDQEKRSERTAVREAFFLEFARAIRRELPNVVLMVTGGFRTRQGMESALANGDCDLIGIGRPAVLDPALPKNKILNAGIKDEDARLNAKKIETPWLLKRFGPRAIGAGIESAWYSKQMQKIGW